MDITCISDLHGHYPKLQGGDLLIVAGDCLRDDSLLSRIDFFVWLQRQKYKERIYIAGNHDNSFEKSSPSDAPEGIFLCDSGTEFLYWPKLSAKDVFMCGREKLKIWGSPWTLRFEGMNPDCTAFTCETEEELAEKWVLIPDDIDILVTHSPPDGILDTIGQEVTKYGTRDIRAGSKSLRDKVYDLKHLKLHCFGHIHEGYNKMTSSIRTAPKEKIRHPIYVNASHVNERYEPVNKPIRIEL